MQTTETITVDTFLETFEKDINQLNMGNNIAIGGSYALRLHGLNTWEPEDLDIVVFQPNDLQYQLAIMDFQSCADEYMVENKGDKVRSWKRSKNGLVMNIIFEYDKPTPEGLLMYRHEHLFKPVRVNSIHFTLEAKLSYSEGRDKKYLRRKDMGHMLYLKNNNFNIDFNEPTGTDQSALEF